MLSLSERAVARLAGFVEGEFLDWDEINEWTDSILKDLEQR